MKGKKVVKLKDGLISKNVYVSNDKLITSLFLESKEQAFAVEGGSPEAQAIINCINRLYKKNMQTKLKASNELKELLEVQEESALCQSFSSFITAYGKSIYVYNSIFRQNLNTCLELYVSQIKQKIKKHVQSFLPHLYISLFDTNKNVNGISMKILSTIFPEKEKEKENSKGDGDLVKREEYDPASNLRIDCSSKLYINIMKTQVNVINLYHCLKYSKEELHEAITLNIKRKNEEDTFEGLDVNIYLVNSLSALVGIIYVLTKYAKEQCNDEQEIKQKIIEEYPNFSKTYIFFFERLITLYKEHINNYKIKVVLFLCVYNILYIFNYNQLNYMEIEDELISTHIFDFINILLQNKEGYTFTHLSHMLDLFFTKSNAHFLTTNFLMSYLSFFEDSTTYVTDQFSFDFHLLLNTFKEAKNRNTEQVKKYFMFFILLLFFLLLQGKTYTLDAYYRVMASLLENVFPEYFGFIEQILKEHTNDSREEVMDIIEKRINEKTEKEKNDSLINGQMLIYTKYEKIFMEDFLLLPLKNCLYINIKGKEFSHFMYKKELEQTFEEYAKCKIEIENKKVEPNKTFEQVEKELLCASLSEDRMLENLYMLIKNSQMKNVLLLKCLRLVHTSFTHISESFGIYENKQKEVIMNETDNTDLYCKSMNTLMRILSKLEQVMVYSEKSEIITKVVREYFAYIISIVFKDLFKLFRKWTLLIDIFSNHITLLLLFVKGEMKNSPDPLAKFNSMYSEFLTFLKEQYEEEAKYMSCFWTCTYMIKYYFEQTEIDTNDQKKVESFLLSMYPGKEKIILEKYIVRVTKDCKTFLKFMNDNDKVRKTVETFLLQWYNECLYTCSTNQKAVDIFQKCLLKQDKNGFQFNPYFYYDVLNLTLQRIEETNKVPSKQIACLIWELLESESVKKFLRDNYEQVGSLFECFLFVTFLTYQTMWVSTRSNTLKQIKKETVEEYMYLMRNVFMSTREKEVKRNINNKKNEQMNKESVHSVLIYVEKMKKTFSIDFVVPFDERIELCNDIPKERNHQKTLQVSLSEDTIYSTHFVQIFLKVCEVFYETDKLNRKHILEISLLCFSPSNEEIIFLNEKEPKILSELLCKNLRNKEMYVFLQNVKLYESKIIESSMLFIYFTIYEYLECNEIEALTEEYDYKHLKNLNLKFIFLILRTTHEEEVFEICKRMLIKYTKDREFECFYHFFEVLKSMEVVRSVVDVKVKEFLFEYCIFWDSMIWKRFIVGEEKLHIKVPNNRMYLMNEMYKLCRLICNDDHAKHNLICQLLRNIYLDDKNNVQGVLEYLFFYEKGEHIWSDFIDSMCEWVQYLIQEIEKIEIENRKIYDKKEVWEKSMSVLVDFLHMLSAEPGVGRKHYYQKKKSQFTYEDIREMDRILRDKISEEWTDWDIKYESSEEKKLKKGENKDKEHTYEEMINIVTQNMSTELQNYLQVNLNTTKVQDEVTFLNLLTHINCIYKLKGINLFENLLGLEVFMKYVHLVQDQNLSIVLLSLKYICMNNYKSEDILEIENDDIMETQLIKTLEITQAALIHTDLYNHYITSTEIILKKVKTNGMNQNENQKEKFVIPENTKNMLLCKYEKYVDYLFGNVKEMFRTYKKEYQMEGKRLNDFFKEVVSLNENDEINLEENESNEFCTKGKFLFLNEAEMFIQNMVNILHTNIFLLNDTEYEKEILKLYHMQYYIMEIISLYSHLSTKCSVVFLDAFRSMWNISYSSTFEKENENKQSLENISTLAIIQEEEKENSEELLYDNVFVQIKKMNFLDMNDDNNVNILGEFKRKVQPIYVSTYYLYILFHNFDIFKNNHLLYIKAYEVILSLCFLFNNLRKLRDEEREMFVLLSSYLFMESDSLRSVRETHLEEKRNPKEQLKKPHNLFLVSLFEQNLKYEDFMLRYFDAFVKEKLQREQKEQEELSRRENDEDDEEIKREEMKEIMEEEKEKEREMKRRQEQLMSNLSTMQRSFVEYIKKENETQRDLTKNENEEKGEIDYRIPWYILKNQMKNMFSHIELDNYFINLYFYIFDYAYLEIILRIINVCLSVKIFDGMEGVYQKALHLFDKYASEIYDYFDVLKKIEMLVNEEKQFEGHRTQVYLFFFSLYLTILLITLYPKECARIVKDKKYSKIKDIHIKYISRWIIKQQVHKIKQVSALCNSCMCSYDISSREMNFEYVQREDTVEDTTVALVNLKIVFPFNYPFSHLLINYKFQNIVNKTNIQKAIQSLGRCARSGNLTEVFIKFKMIMDEYFENTEECGICFLAFHEMKPCDKACPVCKRNYHSKCLQKWFKVSHFTQCPTCKGAFT